MEISVKHLSKKYKSNKYGLKDFNLELKNGILGLIGPNGAGKSTLMRILATISRPTEGQVTLDGVDIVKYPDTVRKVLGYLPQDFGIYPNLTAVEFLEYIAAIKGFGGKGIRMRIEALLDELNLTAVRNRAIGSYSGGMKQRIGILSSHIVSDIESVASAIAIVFQGRVLEHTFPVEKGTLEDVYMRAISAAKNGGNHGD